MFKCLNVMTDNVIVNVCMKVSENLKLFQKLLDAKKKMLLTI